LIEIESFYKIKEELSVTKDGLIMRGTRVVIPKILQNRVIRIAHGGHLGMVKTKQLLRCHVWFPAIDSLVENAIKACHKCQINTDLTKFEPSCPTEMPDGPWALVSVDFYGPLKCGKYLLVLICEYSRYPLVKVISGTSARTVIPVLNEIFSIFGIPGALKSDNGPPFNSFEFKQFSIEQGFKHKKITPLWPRANGMCERFMRNLGKIMRNCSSSQVELEAKLIEFLLQTTETLRIPLPGLLQTNFYFSQKQ
jgi:transposase InsO family protein